MQGDKLRGRKGEKPLSAAEASALKRELALKKFGGTVLRRPPNRVRCALISVSLKKHCITIDF